MAGTDFDVIIVGAGGAGCAAAMRLPAGARALLVDRGDPADGRCCGGLLAPDAQRAIARLGLDLPETVRVQPAPQRVHVRDLDSGLEQTYRRRYWNVDRAKLDAWLLEEARRRAEFLPHVRFVGLAREPGRIVVHVVRDGKTESLSSRLLVGADGARSAVRRTVFPERPGPRTAIAIQVRLAAGKNLDAHEVFFSSRHTDFYAWAIPKPGAVLVGSAFGEPQGARRRFEDLLARMRESLALEDKVLERSARLLGRPRARAELFGGAGPVLLAGEAAGLVSPSSGEGISFALESGAAAGEAIGGNQPARNYERVFRHLARRVRRKFLKARVIFSPRWRRVVLRLPWCP